MFKLEVYSNVDTTLSSAVYYTHCLYIDKTTAQWSDHGLTPLSESIAEVAACRSNHMTSFGGTMLVSPDQLDFTDLTVCLSHDCLYFLV